MPRRIVTDSGPLIALFDKDDSYHDRAVDFLRELTGVLITNYAVVTEVTHLLDFSTRAQAGFLQWIADGGITMADILNEDLVRILELTRKYSDLPIDFADASLVALCERTGIQDVASVDEHFGVYRTRDKKGLKNVFPA